MTLLPLWKRYLDKWQAEMRAHKETRIELDAHKKHLALAKAQGKQALESAQGNAAAVLESESRVERLEEQLQFMTRALSAEMEQQYGSWLQGEGPVG